MDFSQIKTSFIEHKNQILIGLSAGFVIVAIIAGLIGGNTGLFKGEAVTTGAPPEADPTPNVCEATEYTGFIALLKEININIGKLNDLTTINIDNTPTTGAIDTLLLSLAAIVPTSNTTYDSNNCFTALEADEAQASIAAVTKNIEKIELIKQTITAFNTARVTCQAQTEGENACKAIKLDILDIGEDDLSCNTDRIYDKVSKNCVAEVLVCEYTDLYQTLKDANDLLEEFSDDPEDFGDDDEDDELIEYLEDIQSELDVASQDVLDDFIDDFDYEDDAEDLSEILVLAATAIIEDDSELCEDLDELEEINVSQNNNSNNNGNDEKPDDDVSDLLNGGKNSKNSCPANASYNKLLESCLCDATDELITSSGSCPVFRAAEEDPGDSGSFVCEDGTVASDISACIALPGDGAFDNEFDPSGLPADPDDDVEIGLDDETGIDDQQLIDEAIEGINGDAQNPDNTATITNNSQTLNSATSANVMKSGIIQGDTGPGILISVLISFLGTLTYYSFSTRKSF